MLQINVFGEVTQIKLSRDSYFTPGTHVSAYLVDGLLIDSGPAYTVDELVAFLRDMPLKMVVNTHHHEDHIAANHKLKEHYGVEIFAHALAVDKINQPALLYPYQEEVWGYPVPTQVKTLGDVIETSRFRFQVIYTPGHERDHICLFEQAQGWVFTGDLYVKTRPVAIRPQDQIWQIIADLERIHELNPRTLFTSPGKVVQEPRQKLEQTISYLKTLGRHVRTLHGQGLSAEEIVQRVFGQESPLAEYSQQQFSSLNLVNSFLKSTCMSAGQRVVDITEEL